MAVHTLNEVLSRNWWAVAMRGVLGIVFGLYAFVLPAAAMLSLVYAFAIYMFADGVFAVMAAVRAATHHRRWGFLTFEGIADIAAGVLAALWPAITLVVFIFLIAAWALISGALMVGAAFSLGPDHGRWWLGLAGLVSIAYGVLLLIAPLIGAVVLTWWIGAYAIVFGVSLLILAYRLRSRHLHHAHAAAVGGA